MVCLWVDSDGDDNLLIIIDQESRFVCTMNWVFIIGSVWPWDDDYDDNYLLFITFQGSKFTRFNIIEIGVSFGMTMMMRIHFLLVSAQESWFVHTEFDRGTSGGSRDANHPRRDGSYHHCCRWDGDKDDDDNEVNHHIFMIRDLRDCCDLIEKEREREGVKRRKRERSGSTSSLSLDEHILVWVVRDCGSIPIDEGS